MNVGELIDEVLAGPVTFDYWWSEVVELWVELWHLNPRGIAEEWGDVCALGLAHLAARGWPVRRLPLLPGFGLRSAVKFERRLDAWCDIFAHHAVDFRREYLIEGGNYLKLGKVYKALQRAGIETVDVTWLVTEWGIDLRADEAGRAVLRARNWVD